MTFPILAFLVVEFTLGLLLVLLSKLKLHLYMTGKVTAFLFCCLLGLLASEDKIS